MTSLFSIVYSPRWNSRSLGYQHAIVNLPEEASQLPEKLFKSAWASGLDLLGKPLHER